MSGWTWLTSSIALWEVLLTPHSLETVAKSKQQGRQEKTVQPERWDRVEGKDKRMENEKKTKKKKLKGDGGCDVGEA